MQINISALFDFCNISEALFTHLTVLQTRGMEQIHEDLLKEYHCTGVLPMFAFVFSKLSQVSPDASPARRARTRSAGFPDLSAAAGADRTSILPGLNPSSPCGHSNAGRKAYWSSCLIVAVKFKLWSLIKHIQ